MENIESAASRVARRLTEKLCAGDRAALAQAITAVENETGELAAEILKQVAARKGHAAVIGFTGPPGAGKSTLIDAYVASLRRAGRTVAVAAVDPSSTMTGGAVLGDRLRMGRHIADDGVYIRSLASRGHLGGLSENLYRVIRLLDAAGWDVVAVETVGTGQSEIEIAEIADVKVVINAPGLGDDVQAIKAGILEIADILVVNKADLPAADGTLRQLQSMLKLREEARQNVPVLATEATSGRGVDAMREAIDAAMLRYSQHGREERALRYAKRILAQSVARLIKERLLNGQTIAFDALAAALANGSLDLASASRLALAGGLHAEEITRIAAASRR